MDQVMGLADVSLTIEEKSNKIKQFSYGFASRFLYLLCLKKNTHGVVFNLL